MTYNDGKIEYSDVKTPQTIFKLGPLGVENSITYNGDSITDIQPKVINAVDIDWNKAHVNGHVLETTSDLLDLIKGFNDKTSFEIWKENELKSGKSEEYLTEENFIKSLKGELGPKGDKGEQGPKGDIGPLGQSAFELAKENGYSGNDEKEWLESLIPKLNVGTVNVNHGSTASVNITLDGNEVVFDFILPSQDILQIDIPAIYKDISSTGNVITYILKSDNSNNYFYSKGWVVELIKLGDGLYSLNETETLDLSNAVVQKVKVNGNTPELNTGVVDLGSYTTKIQTSESGNTVNVSNDGVINLTNVFEPKLNRYVDQTNKGTLIGKINSIDFHWGETINVFNNAEEEHNINNIFGIHFKSNASGATPSETGYIFNTDAITRLVHVSAKDGKPTLEELPNPAEGNNIYGAFSIGLGYDATIGKGGEKNRDFYKSIFSTAEGYGVNIQSAYAHGEGFNTEIFGNYSFGGGLNDGDIKSSNIPTDNYAINGHYSFGYGKNIRTYNNGEVAFGYYNNSRKLNTVRIPKVNNAVYDNRGNEWIIEDYYKLDVINTFSCYGNTILLSNIQLKYLLCKKLGLELDIDGQNDYESSVNEQFENFVNNSNIIDWALDENYNGGDASYIKFLSKLLNTDSNPVYVGDGILYNKLSDIIDTLLIGLINFKSVFSYNYTFNSSDFNEGDGYHGMISPSTANTQEEAIIGVIAHDPNDESNKRFFIWGPDYLYYNDSLFTKFSIGNGDQYNRNNLFEVTNDGNVYYKNGDKNLFDLESELGDVKNTIGNRIEKLNNEEINISDSTPSIIVLNKYREDGLNVNIYLNINESSKNYYKKTLIIDSSKFLSLGNIPTIRFNSNNINYFYETNSILQEVTGSSFFELELASTLDDFRDNLDRAYLIEIELVYTDCFVNVKTYIKK